MKTNVAAQTDPPTALTQLPPPAYRTEPHLAAATADSAQRSGAPFVDLAPPPSVHSLASSVSYRLDLQADRRGWQGPVELGVGNFARVFRGIQRNAGHDVRAVAIKILHPGASVADELLFRQEIDLLRSLSDAGSVNVIRALDVLQLGPMVMCGCGRIYEPLCPRGCQRVLVRRDLPDRSHPALRCPVCPYEMPGHLVDQRVAELMTAPAKACCAGTALAQAGTLINFVNRDALVMEQIDTQLEDFPVRRREALQRLCTEKGIALPAQRGATVAAGPVRRAQDYLSPDRPEALLARVALLEKTLLLLQLTETVAWLHGPKRIIHKDLAPDNVMIRFSGTPGEEDWRTDRRTSLGLRDVLTGMASYPTFTVQLIDFGLADRDRPSRSWYDDSTAVGHKKEPFLSPEAQGLNRKQRINPSCRLDFEHEVLRFRVPPELMRIGQSIKPGDVLVDTRDYEHRHDLLITRVDEGEGYAYYEGTAPRDVGVQQFELVRSLCEPHDVYALGAIYYYLLTEDYSQVASLRGLVDGLQKKPCPLTPTALRERDLYPSLREALREKYWQDEAMILILRAMTRGLPESFAASRIERGPEPAQRMLTEVKRLYYCMQREILGARPSRLRPLVLPAAAVALLGLSGGVLWQARRLQRLEQASVVAVQQAVETTRAPLLLQIDRAQKQVDELQRDVRRLELLQTEQSGASGEAEQARRKLEEATRQLRRLEGENARLKATPAGPPKPGAARPGAPGAPGAPGGRGPGVIARPK